MNLCLLIPGPNQRRLVVLHDFISVLLVSYPVPVLGRETQGLLADVYSSHRDDCVTFFLVGLQSAQDWNVGTAVARLC